MSDSASNNLLITKERLKGWSACTDGYRWFLEKFPHGAEFAEVYAALQAGNRNIDSWWLADRVLDELDAPAKVQQTLLISGADSENIRAAIESTFAKAEPIKPDTPASSTGDRGAASSTGAMGAASSTGDRGAASSTGDRGAASSTGDRGAASSTGAHSVAMACGYEGRAMANESGAIVLVHRNDDGEIVHIRASKVGENGIKPGVWYVLNAAGEFEEIKK